MAAYFWQRVLLTWAVSNPGNYLWAYICIYSDKLHATRNYGNMNDDCLWGLHFKKLSCHAYLGNLLRKHSLSQKLNCDRLIWENPAYGIFCENLVWCIFDKLYPSHLQVLGRSCTSEIAYFVHDLITCMKIEKLSELQPIMNRTERLNLTGLASHTTQLLCFRQQVGWKCGIQEAGFS